MQYIVINIIIVTIKSLDIVTNIVPISCVQARAAQLRREAWRETWPQLQQLQLLHCYSCSLVTLSAGLTSAQHTLSSSLWSFTLVKRANVDCGCALVNNTQCSFTL